MVFLILIIYILIIFINFIIFIIFFYKLNYNIEFNKYTILNLLNIFKILKYSIKKNHVLKNLMIEKLIKTLGHNKIKNKYQN
jgi:hypothetical protein